MTRCAIAICILLCCRGCGPEADRPLSEAFRGRWAPARSTRVQVQTEALGEVPNNGLLLPAVSPDGRWIAYLALAGDRPAELDDLLAGEPLNAMSLHLREMTVGATDRLICPAGAAWPAWSADSRLLVFVAYDEHGRSDICIYDVTTGETRRKSVGLKGMMMPAISYSGKQVAVVVAPRDSQPSRLYVVDVETGRPTACPADDPKAHQLCPQWTSDGRIVYVSGRAGRAWLAQWGPGRFPPETICAIRMPASSAGRYQMFAGLGPPLSADGRRFAYYDAASDRIVLVSLPSGERTELRAGTRSGCWLDRRRFVAATDSEMLLFGQSNEPVRLMEGSYLPRRSAGATGKFVLCARGSHRRALALLRLKVISAE